MRSSTFTRGASAVVVASAMVFLSACASDSGDTSAGSNELIPIVYTQSTPTLSFAPVIVARDMGFFEEEGIDLEFSTQDSGSVATQALLSDSVQFAGLASTDIAGAVANGAQLTAVQSMMNMTLEVCVSNTFLDETGVSTDDSVERRLAALKGHSVGITAAGSVSDRGLRWLLSDQGGLTPDEDVTVVSVNGASAMNAALQTDQISAYLLSPPFCESAVKEGFATVLVAPDEVEEFSQVVLQIVVAQDTYIEENPDVVRKFAAAMTKGNEYIKNNTAEAVELLKAAFPQTDPDIIDDAVTDLIAPQVPAAGAFTEAGWQATKEILIGAGTGSNDLDVSEGGFWTNEFVDAE